MRRRSNRRSGNWISRALPIVSALIPVLSERKKTGMKAAPPTRPTAHRPRPPVHHLRRSAHRHRLYQQVGLTRDVHYSKIKVTELIPGKKVVVGLLHRRQSGDLITTVRASPPNPDGHTSRGTRVALTYCAVRLLTARWFDGGSPGSVALLDSPGGPTPSVQLSDTASALH